MIPNIQSMTLQTFERPHGDLTSRWVSKDYHRLWSKVSDLTNLTTDLIAQTV